MSHSESNTAIDAQVDQKGQDSLEPKKRKEPKESEGPKESETQKEHKPYIGDEGVALETTGQKAKIGITLIVVAIVLGFICGFLIWGAFILSSMLTDLLWHDGVEVLQAALDQSGAISWWIPLVVTTIGGFIIGLWTKYTHAMPVPTEEVLADVKQTGKFAYRHPFATIIGFLLPLVFGGAIGPEAGLTGLIAHACTVIGGALRRRGINMKGIADISIAAAFAGLFVNPLVGVAVSTTDAMPQDDLKNSEKAFDPYTYDFKRQGKIVLYSIAAIASALGAMAVSNLLNASSGLPRFDGIIPEAHLLWWIIPCIAVGYIGALLYHTSNFSFGKLGDAWSERPILKPVLCGIILGAMAIFCPMVLFPGEEQLFEMQETWQTYTMIALFATGYLKCIATPMCLNMGWNGGNIFPLFFSGAVLGYGMSLVSGIEPMFCVAIVSSALIAGVQRKVIISIALLLLVFSPATIIWSMLAIIVCAIAPMPKAFFPNAQPRKKRLRMNDKTDELVEIE